MEAVWRLVTFTISSSLHFMFFMQKEPQESVILSESLCSEDDVSKVRIPRGRGKGLILK
jgi:hypothetical protein